MANSLFDLWGGGGYGGGQMGGGMPYNTLAGLGLGLMSGTVGDPYGPAMRGFAQGSQSDAAERYRMAQMRQHQADQARAQANADRAYEFQKQQAKQSQENWAQEQNRVQIVGNPETGYYAIDRYGKPTGQTGAFAPGGGPAAPGMIIPPQHKLTSHEQTSIEKADEATTTNQNAIENLQYAKKLSPNAPAGLGPRAADFVAQIAPEYASDQVKNRMLLQNATASNAVEQLRSIFGGNPTEGERKILIELQGSINQPDEVRQQIYDRAIEMANKRLQMNQQRSQQIRGGTYYRPGGGGFGPQGGGDWTDVGNGIKIRPK